MTGIGCVDQNRQLGGVRPHGKIPQTHGFKIEPDLVGRPPGWQRRMVDPFGLSQEIEIGVEGL
ncbi:MAG: hypothetical protein WDN06_21265 [Asticcacaulis sp.]